MTLNHHAYYLEGPTELLPEVEAQARAALGFEQNSPDVYAQAYEKFGIEDARALRARAALHGTTGRALFMVATASLQSEAQQALLKVLEEPSPGTTLVFIVPHGTLLPTVRSRCLPFPLSTAQKRGGQQSVEHSNILKNVSMFLGASAKERSAYIAEMLEDDEGERERVRTFLHALEGELYAAFRKEGASVPTRERLARGLEDTGRFRAYLGDRAPSLKMMLEHLAATLPVV